MSERYLKGTIPMVMEEFGEEKGKRIVERMRGHLDKIIKENPDDPKELIPHSVGQIYPLIAFQIAFEEEGMSREEAYDWLYDHMMVMCEDLVRPLRKILKLGLWRIVPHLFNTVTWKTFGPEAGFRAEIKEATNKSARFDMVRCPYWDKFQKYGYPELCRICCASDDATYGNLHPRLKWERSNTLARGGSCCDFSMKITDKQKLS